MKEYNTIDDFDVENKKVLLRVDFNMPLDKKTLDIIDDTRIRLALPTIEELIRKKAKIVILAHQGKHENKNKKYNLIFDSSFYLHCNRIS
jgi:phosphoglycerate kinase